MKVGRSVRVVVLRLAAVLHGLGGGSIAHANDSSFGGDVSALVPLSQSQVQMRSEDIVLTAHDHERRWDVQASYVFYNHAPTATTLQVGFPERHCEPDEQCMDTSFKNLRTLVGGQAVVHKQGKLSQHHEWANYLGPVWLFYVTFPPQQELRIEHTFSLGSGIDVEDNRFTTYVTRTGIGWAKSIDKARFTARLPAFTRRVQRPNVEGLHIAPPRTANDGRVELVLEGTSWVPRGDIEFRFNASPRREGDLSDKPAFDGLDWRDSCLEKQTPDDPQGCINLLYASKGYPFKSSALRQLYYAGNPAFQLRAESPTYQRWVRDMQPLIGFNTSWFSPEETTSIERWKAQVSAKPPDNAAASESAGSTNVAEPEVLPAPERAVASTEASASTASPAAAVNATPPATAPPAPAGSAESIAPKATSSCGCRVVASARSASAWWVLGAGVVLLGQRRRALCSRKPTMPTARRTWCSARTLPRFRLRRASLHLGPEGPAVRRAWLLGLLLRVRIQGTRC